MKCVTCSAALEKGARFCVSCGTQQPGAVIPQAAVRSFAKTVMQGSNVAAPPLLARAPQSVAPVPAAMPAEVSGELVGKLLNQRYRLEAKIGEGGFGAVYRAVQLQMNRKVAVKVLHSRMAKDPQVVGRFKREAQASSQLRAPHTVQVYDFDQCPDGTMYLAMELLEGRSLHDVIAADGPLTWARAARVLDGIAESLGEAHGQGIVHRDIKPENIFLESRPEPDFVKVLDFGIAKIISGEALGLSGPALTAAGQTLGTLEYMSPEQLMGQPLDGRSDLYALGILGYELVTGSLPFLAKTPGDMITAHLKRSPPPPSRSVPAIPSLFDEIIGKLLAKQRDQRHRDAGELRADLARLVRGADAPTGTPTLIAAVAPTVVRAEASDTERVTLAPPTLGRRWLLLGGGLVLALAATVLLLLLFVAR